MLSVGLSGASTTPVPFTPRTPTLTSSPLFPLQSGAFFNGLFVILSGSQITKNYLVSSNFGLTWTTRALPVESTWGDVQVVANQIVSTAGFLTSTLYRSSDGINWTSGTLPISGYYWKFVHLSNGNTIGLSTNGVNAIVVSANNGLTSWTSGTHPQPSQSWLTTDGTFAYLLTNAGYIYRSLNGTSWTEVRSSGERGEFYFFNNHFVIISAPFSTRPGVMYVSTGDLTKWYEVSTPHTIYRLIFDQLTNTYLSTDLERDSVYLSRNLTDWQEVSLQTVANHNFWTTLAVYDGIVIAAPQFETGTVNYATRIYRISY